MRASWRASALWPIRCCGTCAAKSTPCTRRTSTPPSPTAAGGDRRRAPTGRSITRAWRPAGSVRQVDELATHHEEGKDGPGFVVIEASAEEARRRRQEDA